MQRLGEGVDVSEETGDPLERVGTESNNVSEEILLAALGRGRLPGILDIAARYHIVVFGTMDGKVLSRLTAHVASSPISTLPVYLYETG